MIIVSKQFIWPLNAGTEITSRRYELLVLPFSSPPSCSSATVLITGIHPLNYCFRSSTNRHTIVCFENLRLQPVQLRDEEKTNAFNA